MFQQFSNPLAFFPLHRIIATSIHACCGFSHLKTISWSGFPLPAIFSALPCLLHQNFPQEKSLLSSSFLSTDSPAAAAAKSLQSCLTLCDPVDGSPPGSSIPGILQARTLEWVAISFSNACIHAKLLQLFPTVCDPTGSSPPGSSVHGIL